jgi:putative SOS response-associated peptidase YedK
MCGRYTLSIPLSTLVDAFDVEPPRFDYPPRFNIAPTQDAPVIAQDGRGRRMGLLRWGLVPSWAKDLSVGSRMINARSETAHEKPAFRSAFRKRRCLIPADGFFEWKKIPPEDGGEKGGKAPFWIHRSDREPFLMAGLWERWTPPNGDPVHSFTILTTDAAPSLRAVHHRMPVILPFPEAARWVDPAEDPAGLRPLLRPNADGIQMFPVSTVVNSPRNDTPECIEAV